MLAVSPWPLSGRLQGAFAKVMKARCPSKGPGVNVAIKVMSLENITTSLEEIQAEVKTMKLSRHENVLDLFCCFVVRSSLWLVTPLMDKGSCYYCLRTLRKLHHWSDGQGLPEDVIATILKETLQGLDYIHGHGQIHRDVKVSPCGTARHAAAAGAAASWVAPAAALAVQRTQTGQTQASCCRRPVFDDCGPRAPGPPMMRTYSPNARAATSGAG